MNLTSALWLGSHPHSTVPYAGLEAFWFVFLELQLGSRGLNLGRSMERKDTHRISYRIINAPQIFDTRSVPTNFNWSCQFGMLCIAMIQPCNLYNQVLVFTGSWDHLKLKPVVLQNNHISIRQQLPTVLVQWGGNYLCVHTTWYTYSRQLLRSLCGDWPCIMLGCRRTVHSEIPKICLTKCNV